MSKGDFSNAIKKLRGILLPNGLKQIAIVLLANCYARTNEIDLAVAAYADAIDSEKTWGGRSNKDVTTYIIGYAEFFKSALVRSKYGGQNFYDVDLYERLLALNVPDMIKGTFLPLPLRSSIRSDQ